MIGRLMNLNRSRGVLLVALIATVLVSSITGGAASIRASAQGPANLGFEDGVSGGVPIGWTADPVADVAVVVSSEGPPAFSYYPEIVNPYRGDLMLRIGTPKKTNEKQESGPTTVSQTFTPVSESLRLAFRLISWEHRGNDYLVIDLADDTGSVGELAAPVVIVMPDGTTMQCDALPCEFVGVDVGDRKELLDSGWTEIEIVSIPSDNPVTLSYTVAGTDNSAHATWAYFDDVSQPPVAKFTFSPVDEEGVPVGPEGRLEGSVVQFKDLSTDPDPGDFIVAWEWEIDGPGLPGPLTSGAQNPSFIPPDDGIFVASLTVTSSDGSTDTVVSGTAASDGDLIPAVEVGNAAPLPNALNVEVLDGEDLSLVGRFADTGWLDTHSAQWEVAVDWTVVGESVTTTVALVEGDVLEDHTPALGTGYVGGTLSADELAAREPGDIVGGLLRVTDNAGDFRDDNFAIRIVADDPERHEAHDGLTDNDSINSSLVLASDAAYLSYIQSAGDVDVFEVKWPGIEADEDGNPVQLDPQELLPGSEVLVTLRDMPADYDLVVLTTQPETAPWQLSPWQLSPWQLSPWQLSPWQLSPWQLSPWQLSPWQLSPWQLSPWQLSPWQLSPWQLSPWQLSPWQLSPWQLSQFDVSPWQLSPWQLSPWQLSPWQLSPWQLSPWQLSPYELSPFQLSPLSKVSFIGLEGDEISGTDISLAELGLSGFAAQGAGIAGFSANSGLEDESVLVRVDAPGTRVFAVIIGSNGAHSLDPYTLQLETSAPFSEIVLASGGDLGEEYAQLCSGDPLVASPTPLTTLYEDPAPETLIVTQRERMIAKYGQAAWDNMLAELVALSAHDKVHGKIISVPSGVYDAWDTNQCSIEAANDVADEIRSIIQAELASGIGYVVVAGDDEIVPFRRVPDETVISNERHYLMSAFLEPGSALFASIMGGYNLSDDYYVDLGPTPWQGRALYVPDVPMGRLVETPEQIAAAAAAFVGSDGILQASTGFVSGYDFFADGANAMADALDGKVTTDRLINETWTAEDLLCGFLGLGAGCDGHDISAVNAHFTTYGALSADGYTSGVNDYITSIQARDAEETDGSKILDGGIVFSMGCHAGLNVPEGSAQAADDGLGIDPAVDFVEAMAIQQAVYIASTGYGLGDDAGLGGTELLMTGLAGKLAEQDAIVGPALVRAKQNYLNSLSAMTVYDEKSSIQTTLYGLPMYDIAGVGTPIVEPPTGDPITITIVDGTDVTTQTVYLDEVVVAGVGTYYTADGDAQVTAGRAIQPRVVVEDITGETDEPVHGVLVTASAYEQISGFDPVIARPTIEWEEDPAEPQTCLPAYWPSELASVNTLDTAGGLLQTLVVVPGQFKCTSGENTPVTGIQKLYTDLSLELLRGASVEDFEPPVVSNIDLSVDGADATITLTATDPSGIDKIVVLRIGETGTTSETFDVEGEGEFTITLLDYSDETLVIQVVDGAGNVTSVTGKGSNLSVIDAAITPTAAYEQTEVTLQTTIAGFEDLTAPVSYIWDFGDGTFVNGLATSSLIEVTHVYLDDDPTGGSPDPYLNKVKVTDSGGGIGVDEFALPVNNLDPVVSITVTPAIEENGVVAMSGSFTDVGILDTHSATVDWGDGTPPEPLAIDAEPGSGTFGASHQYVDDDPSGTAADVYMVVVTVVDDDAGVGEDSSGVVVSNVAPTVSSLEVTPAIEENGTVLLSGSFSDPGSLDTFTVVIDWGPGEGSDTLALGAGAATFSGFHQYIDDNPSGTPSDVYPVSVTVTDDDTGVGTASTNVTVNNVAPEVTAIGDTIVENGVATVSGIIIDPGSQDTFTVVIDWGAGEGSDALVLGAGATAYSATHQYLDDNPSGTASDVYSILVTVTDDDSGVGNALTSVTVINVAPVVEAGPDLETGYGIPVEIVASLTDTGIADTYAATIDWGDGTVEAGVVDVEDGSGIVSGSHVYGSLGEFTATVSVSDDDGGVASDSLTVVVICTDPEGDVQRKVGPDGDLVACYAANDASTLSITIEVAGVISDDFQYRAYLNGTMVKYSAGKVTGPSGATASENGGEITFNVPLASLGLTVGSLVEISAETQSGIPGSPGAGKPDRMPDEGGVIYVIR